MVNYLSDSRLPEDWRFGKEPYSRANPPPVVSRLSFLQIVFFLSSLVLISLLFG